MELPKVSSKHLLRVLPDVGRVGGQRPVRRPFEDHRMPRHGDGAAVLPVGLLDDVA